MPELNTLQSIEHIEQDGYDTLTLIDMGEALTIDQIAEDGEPHTVVIGMTQARALLEKLKIFATEGNA